MTSDNPYSAPTVDAAAAGPAPDLGGLAGGQRLVIYAILLNFLAIALNLSGNPLIGLPIGLTALVMSIIGIVRLTRGLGMGTGLMILCLLLLFVPLVNLITLLVLNGKATARLKAGGWKVGFLGASKPAATG